MQCSFPIHSCVVSAHRNTHALMLDRTALKLTRMHSSRMRTAHLLTIVSRGLCVCPGGGCLPRGGGYHVTYPIMHLILPVCWLLTNWDPLTVQLPIYCWLVMWPARHAGILPSPPQQNFWHTLLKIWPCPNFLAAVINSLYYTFADRERWFNHHHEDATSIEWRE